MNILKSFCALCLMGLVVLAAPAAAEPFRTRAPVAYLIDVTDNRVLVSQNADRRIAPASMTKMMTAYVVFDLVDKGKLRLDQKVTVSDDVWRRWHGPRGGSTMFLSAGEQVSVADLLTGMLTVSGNDAAYALAEGVAGSPDDFVDLMNVKAAEIGLDDSHFASPNGWPDGEATYTTANDLARLAILTIRTYPDLYHRFYGRPSLAWGKGAHGRTIRQAATNPLIGRVEGADGLKTGFTDGAGYCLTGSAVRNGRRLVLVVAGLPSEKARLEESVRLMNWGFTDTSARPGSD
jgi:D-alanyl-D-alanine carboxypeptidase (penicillin-binding protein 5/6)